MVPVTVPLLVVYFFVQHSDNIGELGSVRLGDLTGRSRYVLKVGYGTYNTWGGKASDRRIGINGWCFVHKYGGDVGISWSVEDLFEPTGSRLRLEPFEENQSKIKHSFMRGGYANQPSWAPVEQGSIAGIIYLEDRFNNYTWEMLGSRFARPVRQKRKKILEEALVNPFE